MYEGKLSESIQVKNMKLTFYVNATEKIQAFVQHIRNSLRNIECFGNESACKNEVSDKVLYL